MKKLLCIIANKMAPSFAQSIIARLASKTPKTYILMQNYSASIIAIIGISITAIETHQIPDFKYESAVVYILGLIAAIFAGIGGAAATTTTDPKLISPEVKEKIIEDAGR